MAILNNPLSALRAISLSSSGTGSAVKPGESLVFKCTDLDQGTLDKHRAECEKSTECGAGQMPEFDIKQDLSRNLCTISCKCVEKKDTYGNGGVIIDILPQGF